MAKIRFLRLAGMRSSLQRLPSPRLTRLRPLLADSGKGDGKAPSASVAHCHPSDCETTTLVSALGKAGVAIVVIKLDASASGLLIGDVNRPFEAFTGYAADELVGKSPRQCPALFDCSILCQLNRSLLDGHPFRCESIIQCKANHECAVEWIISPIPDEHGAPAHWIALLRVTSHARPSGHEFEAELQHRTRNLLGTVQSVASQTFGETGEATTFKARLAALGRVQGLKTGADGNVGLGELISREMKAHGIADERLTIEGCPVGFRRAKAEWLALGIHELMTNARKHGALASREGAVSIRWWTHGSGAHRRLMLHWSETRNQPCQAIGQSRGFGRELLERALPYSLGATIALAIGSTGVQCQIDIPVPETQKEILPHEGIYSVCERRPHNHHVLAAAE